VYSPSDVLDLIKAGERLRMTGSTKVNDISSRSHSVLTLTVSVVTFRHSVASAAETMCEQVTETMEGRQPSAPGKLHLVDLAGSETSAKVRAYSACEPHRCSDRTQSRLLAGQASGETLAETQKINKSLSALRQRHLRAD